MNDYQGIFAVTGASMKRYEPNNMEKEDKIGKIAISKIEKSNKE